MLSDTFDIKGLLGRSLETGRTSLSATFTDFVVRAVLFDRAVPILCIDPVSEKSSATFIALSKIERHPSAPPQPYITSITVTRPTTPPVLSQTGRVKNLLSCINCNASRTVISGDTVSGSGVITCDTGVDSRCNPFATARDIISLKPKIPTKRPFSTTKDALRASAILIPVSRRFVCGDTIVAGFPANKLRKVGDPPALPNA
mmetsp:Transcript_1615/g.2632  ORF Transcript_1615/g.2632 Transcript_1615/m.2632 type:complete len:202 (+) Transcript_1615:499-1104(+)